MAKVSVIIPIYNVEQYVEQCVRSVMNQTLRDIEIICVDDGSTDASGEICDKLQNEDDRVKVLHKKNGGLVSARKAGMRLATSEYVGFVDGDDWVETEFYQDLYEAMITYDVSMVESGIIDQSEYMMTARKGKLDTGIYEKEEFLTNIAPYLIYDGLFFSGGVISISACNKLFKKEAFERVYQKLDDRYSMFEDVVSVYSYLMTYMSVYVINKAYYHYRVNAVSIKRKKYDNMPSILRSHCQVFNYFIERLNYVNTYKEQIDYFKLYSLFSSRMDLFDLPDKKMIPYGGVTKADNIVLYGAGMMGINLYRYLVEEHQYKVVAWIDRDYQYLSKYFPVVSPESIEMYEDAVIIIAALKTSAVESIRDYLRKKGIENSRIRWIEEDYLENPGKYLDKAIGNNEIKD